MELNKDYSINIISHQQTGSFVIAPKFNEDTSEQYLNYRKHLFDFMFCNETSEWIEKLDYPHIEIGKVVLVRINAKNEWARGIISKCDYNHAIPEIYLIDTQTFIDKKKKCDLRICPSKYLQLKVPTYTIHNDLCFDMNDESLKNAIKWLIYKNQCDELDIIFTPKSIHNNEYTGVLTINNIQFKKYLQILLKQSSKNKEYNLSIFNPLQFNHLKHIFIPSHSSNLVFLDENLVLSSPDLRDLNNSFENLSCDSLDKHSTTIDYSEDFSDDSSLRTIESSKNNCIIPIASSSSSLSNSTPCSFDEEPKYLSVNRHTDCTCENSEKSQVSTNLETTADNEEKPFIYSLMKKRFSTLKQKDNKELKQKDAECLQNDNVTNISKTLETPILSLSDNNVWWSSDDEF